MGDLLSQRQLLNELAPSVVGHCSFHLHGLEQRFVVRRAAVIEAALISELFQQVDRQAVKLLCEIRAEYRLVVVEEPLVCLGSQNFPLRQRQTAASTPL